MLLNNFFYIDTVQVEKNICETSIHINALHEIFKGHFPSQPIVPGVCLLEMQKEILQQLLNEKLCLQSAPMVKFLTMFIPTQNNQASLNMQLDRQGQSIQVSSTLSHQERIYFKFKGKYIIVA